MPVHYDKRKGRWRFQFRRIIAGKRVRSGRLLPKAWTRAQAEAYSRAEEGRLYSIASGLEPQRYLITDALAVYLTERAPKLANGRKLAQDVAHVLPWLEGRTLDQAPAAFLKYAAEAKVAASTVRNRLAYCRAALRYALRYHKMGSLEIIGQLQVPNVDNIRTVYATSAELKTLWAAFDDDEARAISRLAFYTGLRWRAELHPRQPADVKRERRDVWLLIGTTKNGLPRMAYVPPEAHADLDYLPFKQPVRKLYERFERARERAGMPHLWMHDMRRSLASMVVSSSGTPHELQAVLHHVSLDALKRYAFLYPQSAKRVVTNALRWHTGKTPKPAKKAA